MDIKRILITYSKLGAIMLVAFFIASLLNQEIFINNSPRIRRNLSQHIARRTSEVMQNGSNFVARLPFFGGGKSNSQIAKDFENTVNGSLKDVPFQQVAKGVYAKENEELKYIVIKDGEVEWREYTFTVKGKEVKIKVPAGEEPPPQQRVEQMYE